MTLVIHDNKSNGVRTKDAFYLVLVLNFTSQFHPQKWPCSSFANTLGRSYGRTDTTSCKDGCLLLETTASLASVTHRMSFSFLFYWPNRAMPLFLEILWSLLRSLLFFLMAILTAVFFSFFFYLSFKYKRCGWKVLRFLDARCLFPLGCNQWRHR